MAKRAPDIQEQLRQAILNAGVSRYRLARVTGISDGLLSNFVNRRRSMTLNTAARLAKALGLELRPKGKKG